MDAKDRVLVERFVQKSDTKAFALIATRYADFVFSTCRRILHNDADAADAAQETFFQLLKSAGSVKGSLGSWLHQVATRRAVDLIRQNSSRRRREQQYFEDGEPSPGTWTEVEPLVDEALERLPDKFREVLVLHFLERQSTTRIAAAKGVSQPTISRRVNEALELLRQSLRERGVAVALVPLQVLLTHSSWLAPEELRRRLGKIAMAKAGSSITAPLAIATATGAKTAMVCVALVAATLAWIELNDRTGRQAGTTTVQGGSGNSQSAAVDPIPRPGLVNEQVLQSTPADSGAAVVSERPSPNLAEMPIRSNRAAIPKTGAPLIAKTNQPAPPRYARARDSAPATIPALSNGEPQRVADWETANPASPVPRPLSSPPALGVEPSPVAYYNRPVRPGTVVILGNGEPMPQARVFERGTDLSFARANFSPARPTMAPASPSAPRARGPRR